MLVKNYSIQSKMYYSFKKLLLVSCYTKRDKLQKVFDALSFFALTATKLEAYQVHY